MLKPRSWRNSETLWNQALANTSHNHIAQSNLGDVLLKKGHLDEAMSHFRKALEIDPDYPEANNNLGYALASKGNWADAITSYRVALRVRPNYPKAHNNLAISLAQMGKRTKRWRNFARRCGSIRTMQTRILIWRLCCCSLAVATKRWRICARPCALSRTMSK